MYLCRKIQASVLRGLYEKILAAALALCLALTLTACAGSEAPSSSGSGEGQTSASAYPVRNISGIVQWGAGGGTDSLMRPLAALAEQRLGKSIVIQNMAAAAGSVAAQYVYDVGAIPGLSATMAVSLLVSFTFGWETHSALTIQGLRPGPNLIRETPDLFWLIVAALLLASVFLLVFGLTGIKAFTKIVEIPKGILMPIILVLSVIGAYAIRSSLYDIFWMFGFSLIGYFLKRYNYPVAPIVLGVILTKLCEENYRRGVMLEGSIPGMLGSIFTSPVSIVLFALLVFLSLTQTRFYKDWRLKRDAGRGAV